MEMINWFLVPLSIAAIILPVKFVYTVFRGNKPTFIELISTLIFLVYALSNVYERLFWFIPSFWGTLTIGNEVWHADRYYYGVTLGGLMSLAIMVIFIKYVAHTTGVDMFNLTPPDTDDADRDGEDR